MIKASMKLIAILTIAIMFTVVILIPVAHAFIYIGDIREVYNLGDGIKTNVTILESDSGNYFINLIMACDGNLTYFASPITLEAGKQKIFEAPEFVARRIGDCFIKVNLLDDVGNLTDSYTSKKFSITNRMYIDVDVKSEALPGESLDVKGYVKLASGNPAKGTLRITGAVAHVMNFTGAFSYQLKLREDQRSGFYKLMFFTFDEFGNEGYSEKEFYVKSIPKTLVMKLNNETFEPLDKMVISVILLDQANDMIKENITVMIFNSSLAEDANKVVELNVESNSSTIYIFKRFSKPGEWLVRASAYDLKTEKDIFILPKEEIDLTLVNNTLIVHNIGNVFYSKPLQINLKSEGKEFNLTQNLVLKVDEKISLRLSAPDGIYDVSAEGRVWKGIPLTGRVAMINPLEINIVYAIIVLFIVIAIIILLSHTRLMREFRTNVIKVVKEEVFKRKRAEIKSEKFAKERQKIKQMFEKYVDKHFIKKASELKGKKEATFLFTDMRGFTKLVGRTNPIPILNAYFSIVKNAVHKNNGVVFHLFGDCAANMFDDEFSAVKSAIAIKEMIKGLNKKFNENISIGIGLDSGIVDINLLNLARHQPIGSAVNIACHLSTKSGNQILVTKRLYDKISDRVNAKRLGHFDLKGEKTDVYEILGLK